MGFVIFAIFVLWVYLISFLLPIICASSAINAANDKCCIRFWWEMEREGWMNERTMQPLIIIQRVLITYEDLSVIAMRIQAHYLLVLFLFSSLFRFFVLLWIIRKASEEFNVFSITQNETSGNLSLSDSNIKNINSHDRYYKHKKKMKWNEFVC